MQTSQFYKASIGSSLFDLLEGEFARFKQDRNERKQREIIAAFEARNFGVVYDLVDEEPELFSAQVVDALVSHVCGNWSSADALLYVVRGGRCKSSEEKAGLLRAIIRRRTLE
jgi:hypothetical protein